MSRSNTVVQVSPNQPKLNGNRSSIWKIWFFDSMRREVYEVGYSSLMTFVQGQSLFPIHELLIQRCMNIYEHSEMLKHCVGWFFAWKRLKRASTYVLSVPRGWPTPQWHVSLRKPFISSDPRITHDCHVYRVTLSKIDTVNLFFSKHNCRRYAFDLWVCIRDFRKSIFFLEYSVLRKFLIFVTCKRKWS